VSAAGTASPPGPEHAGEPEPEPDDGDAASEVATVDERPTTLSAWLAVAFASVVAASALEADPLAAVAAAPGVLLVGTAGAVGSRRALSAGAAILFVAVLVAGTLGGGPLPVLVGTVAAVLAWDVADHGLDLGRRVGRDAGTARNELVHAAGGTVVGAVGGAIGYGVFVGAAAGQPVTAVVFLLVGVIALASALSSPRE